MNFFHNKKLLWWEVHCSRDFPLWRSTLNRKFLKSARHSQQHPAAKLAGNSALLLATGKNKIITKKKLKINWEFHLVFLFMSREFFVIFLAKKIDLSSDSLLAQLISGSNFSLWRHTNNHKPDVNANGGKISWRHFVLWCVGFWCLNFSFVWWIILYEKKFIP